jgi:hypothetical protein
MTWIWWAPLLAILLHIFEEFVWPGGFADWDRAYRPEFNQSITPRFHIMVNALLVLAGLQVGLLRDRDIQAHAGVVTPAHVLTWCTLTALLSSNALWHLKGAIKTQRYSPGLVTGLCLYVPLTIFGYMYYMGTHKAPLWVGLVALAIGGSYHFWAARIHKRRAARFAERTSAH